MSGPVDVSIENLMTELMYLIILPANICRRSRRVKNSRLPVSQIGQNDNDRAVQVRRVDGQPVTRHAMADEQGSHEGERLGNLRCDGLDMVLQ